MGFSDEDFDKAAAVNSNTQLYAQAGNSIVVNVLEAIFSQMIEPAAVPAIPEEIEGATSGEIAKGESTKIDNTQEESSVKEPDTKIGLLEDGTVKGVHGWLGGNGWHNIADIAAA